MNAGEVIVLMGVSGSGKTTVAGPLAARLGIDVLDADDLHSPTAIRQMHRGEPLSDTQRDEWMDRVVDAASARAPVVLACSALRRTHRDRLRHIEGSRMFLLEVPPDELRRRLEHRPDHFFDPALLDDQLATLETPGPEEDVVVVDATLPTAELVDRIAGDLGVR